VGILDARVAYAPGEDDHSKSHATIALCAKLFDKYPPYSDNIVISSTEYDQENSDLTGR
jgi:hypothetical protein